jgi:hypothetical protein
MKSRPSAGSASKRIVAIAIAVLACGACSPHSLGDYISADRTAFDSGRNSRVTDDTLAGLKAYPGLTSFALQSARVTPTGFPTCGICPACLDSAWVP